MSRLKAPCVPKTRASGLNMGYLQKWDRTEYTNKQLNIKGKSMKYKVIYHFGNEIGIKTKVESGYLIWQEKSFLLSGKTSCEVPFSSFLSVEMFRLHGTMRMIKLFCQDRTIFLSVVRFSIGGFFATGDFFKNGELFNRFKAQIN
jgi:hypothetical protein